MQIAEPTLHIQECLVASECWCILNKRFSFIGQLQWTIGSLAPAIHQYCSALTVSCAFRVTLFALAVLLAGRVSYSLSLLHLLIILTGFCARHVRAPVCVPAGARNHHLVISLFHTSVVISVDWINYHGDEGCGDPAHLYACRAIMEALLSSRQTSLRTLWFWATQANSRMCMCVWPWTRWGFLKTIIVEIYTIQSLLKPKFVSLFSKYEVNNCGPFYCNKTGKLLVPIKKDRGKWL